MVLKDDCVSVISIDYRCSCCKSLKIIRMRRRKVLSIIGHRNSPSRDAGKINVLLPPPPPKWFGISGLSYFGKMRVHLSPNRYPRKRRHAVDRTANQASGAWPGPHGPACRRLRLGWGSPHSVPASPSLWGHCKSQIRWGRGLRSLEGFKRRTRCGRRCNQELFSSFRWKDSLCSLFLSPQPPALGTISLSSSSVYCLFIFVLFCFF